LLPSCTSLHNFFFKGKTDINTYKHIRKFTVKVRMEADRAAVRVFDLIDSHQLNQAEGALETAMKKYPQDDSLRVAEALLKLRSGNYPLAKKIAVELSAKDITKPKAVNALVHVLQNCCCWEALAATYERLKPLQNERQISENLVQTYARMGAYVKVQQTATQLYRQYNDPKYQVWMVQGMLAQVPANSNDHMLLKLATKLLDAAVLTEKGHIVPSTVQTYVDILAQQGQYTTAVNFLLSERAAKIGLLSTRLEQLSAMLRKVGRVAAANAVARHLWTAEGDNWTSFTLYKDSLLPSAESDVTEEKDTVLEVLGPVPEMRASIDCSTAHHSLEEAVQLAQELQTLEESKHPRKARRGPFLAELDLLNTLHAADELHKKVVAYVERFYRKPSCYLDLSTFLTTATAAAIYAWSRNAGTDGSGDELDAHTRRMLGLRCYVASWDSTPPAAELHALFDECVQAYQGSRALSEGLAWSEEGLCDGYITVALNIALRGYAAAPEGRPDYAFLVKALDALQSADRRMNNPTWLIYSVCFANLLGLTDCAALHQLAFKNVQRDTMTHVGYWPMLTGLALDDVAEWEGWAEDHYSRQERDCSLLRAKVFNYTSWPAMQDVQRFEAAQSNSLFRWQFPANEYAAALMECQTQKDVLESFETRIDELWRAWERLREDGSSATLVDNTDWVVVRSMILGNIHSPQVQELTDALVAVPTRAWQLRRSRQILASAFLLHDMAAVHTHQQAGRQGGRGTARKGGKGKGNKDAATSGTSAAAADDVGPVLYCKRMEAHGAVEYLPAIQPLAKVLRPYIDSLGEVAPDVPDSVLEELRAYFDALVSDAAQPHSAGDFESFLYPQAFFIAALLKMAPAKKLPVKEWATAMKTTLEAAQHRYETAMWSTLAVRAGQTDATPAAVLEQLRGALTAESFAAKLMAEKVRRVEKYVSGLKVELSVYAR
jgi:N-terminal acetyltransferase B complex non-catalytic subunit